jgi:hypothetical protein
MAPKQPELTRFKSASEQKTIFSNVQRWLFNTELNGYTMLDSAKVLETIESTWQDESQMHKALQGLVNQIKDTPGAKPKKETLAVIAAGPSAKPYAPFLPWVFEHCYTITSPTVLPWLSSLGLYPDVVLAADAHPILAEHTSRSGAHEHSNLICCPEVSPLLPMLFGRDKTFWFRTAIPGPRGEMDWEPYSVFMTFVRSIINVRVAQVGCVTNMAISLGEALRQFAGWKWKQIVLIGADYAFTDDEMRLPTHEDENGNIAGLPEDQINNDLADKTLYKGPGAPPEGIKTNGRMIRYKAAIMAIWLQTSARIYSMSHGILTEFPPVIPGQVKTGKWPEYLPEHKIKQRATNFLAWYQRHVKENEEAKASKIEIATDADIAKAEASRNKGG